MVFRVDRDGSLFGLWTDEIDLHKLGRVEVRRASNIEFDDAAGLWRIHWPDGTTGMVGYRRRADALEAEEKIVQERVRRGLS